jgi:hypothetical protein
MALVEQAPEPCLPIEEVTVESLGGEVFVRGMDMPQLLQFIAGRRAASVALEGETDEQANVRAGTEAVATSLAVTVLNAKKLPLYTAAQWRAWGAKHLPDVMKLFAVAMRLSGRTRTPSKKTPEPAGAARPVPAGR